MTNAPASREIFNEIYGEARPAGQPCANSIQDLAKARRRVRQVSATFGLRLHAPAAEVLDVGCGLGFYTKALAMAGARVTGLDVADAAIARARQSFPDCGFVRGAFPGDIADSARFDLVWAVDLSLINTFDCACIHEQFIRPALARLRPGGAIIVGWHTDFSGGRTGNWAHWSQREFAALRRDCGLSHPRLVQVASPLVGRIVMHACKWARRAVPVFLMRRASHGA